jgi:hypothetical protein
MRDQVALSKIINQSGFPLQLAVDELLRQKGDDIGWTVLYREHGWSNPDGQSGFADLVLEDRYRSSVMVLECKRVLDSDWLFLEESGANNETIRTRAWVNNTPGHGKEHSGYYDLSARPKSAESMYCVIAGQDQKSRPLLERVAAETCAATEAIAVEEYASMLDTKYGFRMYIPVIVTTARLSISTVETASIALATGEASAISHREVPFLRFRKQLSSAFAVDRKGPEWGFSELATAREKMVFVVNSMHLEEFLHAWETSSESFRPLM